MKINVLFPMKGGSERVPNKNMKNFDGNFLYYAIVNSLLSSKYIEKIIIDTDSQVIAKDAMESFGDKVLANLRLSPSA